MNLYLRLHNLNDSKITELEIPKLNAILKRNTKCNTEILNAIHNRPKELMTSILHTIASTDRIDDEIQ